MRLHYPHGAPVLDFSDEIYLAELISFQLDIVSRSAPPKVLQWPVGMPLSNWKGSDSEFEEVWLESEDDAPLPADRSGAPRGPPPPRPVQDDQPVAHAIANAVAHTIGFQGKTILTLIPHGLRGIQDLTIEVRNRSRTERDHPNVLDFSEVDIGDGGDDLADSGESRLRPHPGCSRSRKRSREPRSTGSPALIQLLQSVACAPQSPGPSTLDKSGDHAGTLCKMLSACLFIQPVNMLGVFYPAYHIDGQVQFAFVHECLAGYKTETKAGGDGLTHKRPADMPRPISHGSGTTSTHYGISSKHRCRSRPGPKSRNYCRLMSSQMVRIAVHVQLALLFLMITPTTAVEARVGSPEHPGNPEAKSAASLLADKRAKHSGDVSHSFPRKHCAHPIRKRAFARAIHRAEHNDQQTTWYRGRRVRLDQLLANSHDQPRQTHPMPLHQPARRDPLPKARRLRVITWNAGGLNSVVYNEVLTWLQLESDAQRPVDVCVMRKLAFYASLFHVRLLLEAPLDILCIYQHSWNLQKVGLRGPNKQEALLKQRRLIWDHIDKWLRSTPQRNGCLLLGDMNQSLREDHPTCGPGCLPNPAPHPDQTVILDLLRAHRCCVLNTWSRSGTSARTFLSPQASEDRHGTQLDYIVTRGPLVDSIAKQAAPLDAPFVPVTGARHRPVSSSVKSLRTLNVSRLNIPLINSSLKVGPELDEPMIKAPPSRVLFDPSGPLTLQVQEMWMLRGRLKHLSQVGALWSRDGPALAHLFQAWAVSTKLQVHTEAVNSTDIHQAAKKFAPKAPRRRLQLRTETGRLQTHEEEFMQIVDYFETLYHGPMPLTPPCLPQDLDIKH
ncbi:unnamed protein product [Symbiodinium sp. CCMP2592]|nr:unnamed protein product [Symbiodinium sp. CCMP2592]